MNFNTDRVLRWRLIIEEYNPTLVYLKGESNVVADALSRLSTDDQTTIERNAQALSDAYALTELPKDAFPLRYATIRDYQQHDPALLK